MSQSSLVFGCSLVACLAASLSCASVRKEETVAVTSVASIPVAPLATPSGPIQPTSTSTSTPTDPPSSASATDPPSDPSQPARVVLADEIPYRYLSHAPADGAPMERAHPHSHRRGKPGASGPARPYH